MMKKHTALIFILFAVLLIAFSLRVFTNDVSGNEESDRVQIERAINNSIGWAKTKDLGLLYRIIANDPRYLEVQPGDRIVKGFDNFRKAEKFWMHPDFKAISYEIRDLEINVSQSGTVAWYYCVLDDINEWKGKPASWMNVRWTGVLEKRENKWVIVQMHFSNSVND